MIATGIEAAHVEIPVILGNDQHVRLYQITLAPCKPSHEALIVGQLRITR